MERASPRFQENIGDDLRNGEEFQVVSDYHQTSLQGAGSPNGTAGFSARQESASGSVVQGSGRTGRNRMTPEMMIASSSDDED